MGVAFKVLVGDGELVRVSVLWVGMFVFSTNPNSNCCNLSKE